MTHAEQGVRGKRPSEDVYPADILGAKDLMMAPDSAFAVWIKCLLFMWRDTTYEVAGSFEDLGRLWGKSAREAEGVCEEIRKRKIANVTFRNGLVTLTCRRLFRRWQERAETARRVREFREREQSNAPVTSGKGLPSLSPSLSSSNTLSPGPERESDFETAYRILLTSSKLRELTLEQLRAAAQPISPCLVLSAAAPSIVRAATLQNTRIRSVGGFVAKCLEEYEKKNKGMLDKSARKEAQERHDRREFVLDLQKAKAGEVAERYIENQERVLAGRYGKGWVEGAKAETQREE